MKSEMLFSFIMFTKGIFMSSIDNQNRNDIIIIINRQFN